jgi:hypothetical protein
LTYQPENERHMPRLHIDANAIAFRLEALARAGLCPRCEEAVSHVTADTVRLLIEVIGLYDALYLARLESANRLAAMHAALHAASDGEADPLAYLRDELPGNEVPHVGGRRGR